MPVIRATGRFMEIGLAVSLRKSTGKDHAEEQDGVGDQSLVPLVG